MHSYIVYGNYFEKALRVYNKNKKVTFLHKTQYKNEKHAERQLVTSQFTCDCGRPYDTTQCDAI